MSTKTPSGLAEKLVNFSELLRSKHIPIALSEVLDAASALSLIRPNDKEQFYNTLKPCLAKRLDDFSIFDLLFDGFWIKGEDKDALGRNERIVSISFDQGRMSARITTEHADTTLKSKETSVGLVFSLSNEKGDSRGLGGKPAFSLYSAAESLEGRSFSVTPQQESVRALKRRLKRFARQFAMYPGRRFFSSKYGEIDFSKSLRKSLNTGGVIAELRRRSRKISRHRFVILCDISGSMDAYSEEIVTLLYYWHNSVKRTRVFGFSTRLTPLSRYLEGKSLREVKQTISHSVKTWSSGTRIGYALEELLKRHSGDLKEKSVLVIISDGWELGDLESLERNLRDLKRRVAKIIWFNPLADSPDYKPVTAGMERAIPHIDALHGLKIFNNEIAFARFLNHLNSLSVESDSIHK